MTEIAPRLEIDAVDFQIACRRFTIKATITRDRQLPVVDEFVLRLLAVIDRISVPRMRAWFGFTESEIETVLVDMGRRNLIELNDDDVQLAPAGRDLFRSASVAGVPHVVEVSPLIENIWFDLVSRNMVPRSRARTTDYLVKVAEQPSARDLPEAYARAAFEENFRDYARRIKRFADPDAVSLYSISNVEGGIYGYQILRAAVVFDLDRMKVRPIFPELGDNVGSYQKLVLAANEAWQLISPPDLSTTAASEFERMTGETRFTPLINNPSNENAWREASKVTAVQGTGFTPTTGATYLSQNLEYLLSIIGDTKAANEPCEVVWLRPSGSSWGRTQRIPEALVQISDALRNVGRTSVSSTLVMPRSTSKTARFSHKRLFGKGVLLPQGRLPANMEVLIIGELVAIVNVHLGVGQYSVPVGGVVSNPKRLARIVERLTSGSGEGWETLWQSKAESYRRLVSESEDGL